MSIRHSDVSALLNGLDKKAIGFNDVISFIDDFYRYTPVKFSNEHTVNAAGVNEGSAKIFAFAKHHGLNQIDALNLCGEHYQTVHATPNRTDHPNLRNCLHRGFSSCLMATTPFKARAKPDVK